MVTMVAVTISVRVIVAKGLLGARVLMRTMVTMRWIVTVSMTAVAVAMASLGHHGRKEGQILASPGPREVKK